MWSIVAVGYKRGGQRVVQVPFRQRGPKMVVRFIEARNSQSQFRIGNHRRYSPLARLIRVRQSPPSPWLLSSARQRRYLSSAQTLPSSSNWKNQLARFVRYVRIPFLVLSVYQLGYQQGIISYAHDPEHVRKVLLQEVVAGVGCQDVSNDVERVSDDDQVDNNTMGWFLTSSTSKSFASHRVAHISRQVIHVAKLYVQDERTRAADALRAKLPDDLTTTEYYDLLLQDEDFCQWNGAYKRLLGNWTFLVVKTDLPNAFVTEVLPRHLFITSSMLDKVIHNDSELALVLAHELSHFILGHISESNQLQTLMRTFEVLLLSMDPTEGLMSIGVVSLLATLRTALTAAHSRDNEHQADAMGLVLCARACFDTRKASRVFERMHELNVGANNTSRRLLSFADSHPPSQERFELLLESSQVENAAKYSSSYCGTVKSRMQGLIEQRQQGGERT